MISETAPVKWNSQNNNGKTGIAHQASQPKATKTHKTKCNTKLHHVNCSLSDGNVVEACQLCCQNCVPWWEPSNLQPKPCGLATKQEQNKISMHSTTNINSEQTKTHSRWRTKSGAIVHPCSDHGIHPMVTRLQ